MLAFVFSDLHASYKQLANLRSYLSDHKDIDVLISAGDFVNMGEPATIIDKVVEIIQSANLPLMWVPGNNDFGRSYHKLNAKIKSLEGRIVELEYSVISNPEGDPLGRSEKSHGVKGSLASLDPLHGGLSSSLSDEVAHLRVDDGMGRDDRQKVCRFTGVGGSPASWEGQYAGETTTDKIKIAGTVFVSHTPPPGLLVMNKYDCNSPTPEKNPKSLPRRQAGEIRNPKQILNSNVKKSDSFSNFDIRASNLRLADSPIVHICGHQHTRWGCGYLGTTKVINPGPLAEGRYAILDLETLEVEFGRFNN